VSGTRPVAADAQRELQAAAVAAGVPRSNPIALGSNRNFELRREFAADLDAAPIQVTSVLNGAFADMLTGTAPMIAFGRCMVMCWSSADQILDFTTKDDVARVVALVALDADAPRVVEIAGDRVPARSVAQTMSELTGTPFTLRFAGTTGTLSLLAKAVRRFSKPRMPPSPPGRACSSS
jgi:hypothetical protein